MVYIKYINSIYYIVKFIRLGTPNQIIARFWDYNFPQERVF